MRDLHGHRPRKSLGQHFLTDSRVVERQIRYADLRPTDTVLEIGPGPGILTRALAPKVKEVVAIELDRDLAERMRAEGPPNVRLIEGDAVKEPLPPFDVCVANLPYQISSPITFKLLQQPMRHAVLMYQLEFAKRLVAKVGTDDYSRLTVNAQYRATCEILEQVPPSAFSPQPRVRSAIVKLTPRATPPFHVADERLFLAVVHAGFTQRRKKLSNALLVNAALLGVPAATLDDLLGTLPHGDARAETLSPAALAEVANSLHGALVARGLAASPTPPADE